MAEPWNVDSYEGENIVFVHTPPFTSFDDADTVIKLYIEK
jgi:hypothetical protein